MTITFDTNRPGHYLEVRASKNELKALVTELQTVSASVSGIKNQSALWLTWILAQWRAKPKRWTLK